MRPASEIVDEQIAAYVEGDGPRFAALYEDDAVCRFLPGEEIVACGRQEIERVWSNMFREGEVKLIIRNRMVLGRFIVDFETVSLAGRPPVDGVAVYHVGSEKIRNVWFLRESEDGEQQ